MWKLQPRTQVHVTRLCTVCSIIITSLPHSQSHCTLVFTSISHPILSTILKKAELVFYPQFTDEETEALREYRICSKSCNITKQWQNLGIELRPSDPKSVLLVIQSCCLQNRQPINFIHMPDSYKSLQKIKL